MNLKEGFISNTWFSHRNEEASVIVTFDWISFVPTWTTLAADWAADAATSERRPNPWKGVTVRNYQINTITKQGTILASPQLTNKIKVSWGHAQLTKY